MRRSDYPLRLQPSLMEEARAVAESEGVALNQLFNVAVAEKLASLRTEKRFQERIHGVGHQETMQVPDRDGNRNPPAESDDFPIGGLPALIAAVTRGLQGFGKKPRPERQGRQRTSTEPSSLK
jgi:hypothetical protein